MEEKKPLVTVQVDGEEIDLYSHIQAKQLLSEIKLPLKDLESVGLAFPEVYSQTVKMRLSIDYGVPTSPKGALVQGKDNMTFLTIIRFFEAMDYDKDICEMVLNRKNTVLARQIMDIGYPMMCLLTRK